MSDLLSAFDWYAATIDGVDEEQVAGHLALASRASIRHGKSANGYAVGLEVVVAEEVVARVYGRSAREGEVHVVIPGGACGLLLETFRALWPVHRVSRADSCIDFLADFPPLDALAVAFAKGRGLKHSAHYNSEGGATRYLGSRSSSHFARVYKKSEQMRIVHPDRADSIPPGVVRFELEVKPGKRSGKEALAVLSSDDLWGTSGWSQAVAAQILALDVPRTTLQVRGSSTWLRTKFWMGEQYRPAVTQRIEEAGVDTVRSEILALFGITDGESTRG